LRGIYKLTGKAAEPFMELGQRIVELSGYMQLLLREWALLAPEEPEAGFVGMPRFPSVLVDAHLALRDEMTPDETLAYMQMRIVQGEEIAGEFLLRIASELGDDKARTLFTNLNIARWRLQVAPSRIGVESSVGLARRHALSPIARDVERSLGRVTHRTSEATLRALFGHLLAPSREREQSAEA
jgi:hypothetical protein